MLINKIMLSYGLWIWKLLKMLFNIHNGMINICFIYLTKISMLGTKRSQQPQAVEGELILYSIYICIYVYCISRFLLYCIFFILSSPISLLIDFSIFLTSFFALKKKNSWKMVEQFSPPKSTHNSIILQSTLHLRF